MKFLLGLALGAFTGVTFFFVTLYILQLIFR
jgi:hypothetical protein